MTVRKACQVCGEPCRYMTCSIECRDQLRRDRVRTEVEHLLGTDDLEGISNRVGYIGRPYKLIAMLRAEGRDDLADRLDRPRIGHVPQGRIRTLIH